MNMVFAEIQLSELAIGHLGVSTTGILGGLEHFHAADNLMLIVVFTLGGAAAIGHVLDRALGGLAFGIAGNSFLVLMGIIVAVSVGRTHVNLINHDESAWIAVLASSLAAGIVLALGALKAYVLQRRI